MPITVRTSTTPTPDTRNRPIMNGDTTCIPAYGVVMGTGVYIGQSQSDGKGSLIVTRPTNHGNGDLLINVNPCNPGDRGAAHNELPGVVAYQADDPLSRDPAPGEIWGPKTGSWYIHRGYAGFKILGGAGLGLVNVVRHIPVPIRRAVLDTALAPCGHATAIEMRFNFLDMDYCDQGETFTVYDGLSIVQTELDPGFMIEAAYHIDSDRWEVIAIGSEGCCGGSGSGSVSTDCVPTIGGIDPLKLPLYDPDSDEETIGLILQGGCLKRVETGTCGSGSGS